MAYIHVYHDVDTIIVSMGARYKSYCANVGRTYFVNPTKIHKAFYSTLLSLHAHMVTLLKPGMVTGQLYLEAISFLNSHKPVGVDIETWESHLPEYLGFGIGLEPSESYLAMKKSNTVKLEANMVMSMLVAFRNLPISGSKVAMWVIDTAVVTPNGGRLLTNSVKRADDEVMYTLDEEPKKKVRSLYKQLTNDVRKRQRKSQRKRQRKRSQRRRKRKSMSMMKMKRGVSIRKHMY